MSKVTNCILTFPLTSLENEEMILSQINSYEDKRHCFVWLNDPKFINKPPYGGTKRLEVNVLVGAFNHLNLKELLEHLKTKVEWEDIDYVQLFVKEDEDDIFSIRLLI